MASAARQISGSRKYFGHRLLKASQISSGIIIISKSAKAGIIEESMAA